MCPDESCAYTINGMSYILACLNHVHHAPHQGDLGLLYMEGSRVSWCCVGARDLLMQSGK